MRSGSEEDVGRKLSMRVLTFKFRPNLCAVSVDWQPNNNHFGIGLSSLHTNYKKINSTIRFSSTRRIEWYKNKVVVVISMETRETLAIIFALFYATTAIRRLRFSTKVATFIRGSASNIT